MKRAGLIVAVTVGAFLLVVGVLAWQAVRYPETAVGGSTQATVIVEKGISLREIARRLQERGIIKHPTWFTFYGNERGLAQKVKAGRYTFSSAMSPRDVLDKLVEGVPLEETAVTLPEGKNLLQVAELLEQAGVCSKDEVLRLGRDPKFVRDQGLTGDSL
jgi:UPF0755 protein